MHASLRILDDLYCPYFSPEVMVKFTRRVRKNFVTQVKVDMPLIERNREHIKLLIDRYAIAVIAIAPTGKASFVYSYVQTRLKGQYNGKWPFSLVYVLKPLITLIRAIAMFSSPLRA